MNEGPNFIYLDQLSGGNQEIRDRLLFVLKSEFVEEVAEYEMNIANSDFLLAAGIVHKIRHKIGFLGMTKFYDLANEYEHNLMTNSADLKNEFETTLSIVNEFILKN